MDFERGSYDVQKDIPICLSRFVAASTVRETMTVLMCIPGVMQDYQSLKPLTAADSGRRLQDFL